MDVNTPTLEMLADLASALADPKRTLAVLTELREKTEEIARREASIAEGEKALAEREAALDAREEAVLQREQIAVDINSGFEFRLEFENIPHGERSTDAERSLAIRMMRSTAEWLSQGHAIDPINPVHDGGRPQKIVGRFAFAATTAIGQEIAERKSAAA